jgi:hypothetical protein
MPAGKFSQSNAMLYTVITFVGLFVIATAASIWFYVKAEGYRTQRETMEDTISEIANSRERSTRAKLVGKPLKKHSYMGTMLSYFDDMVLAITGQTPEETTASVKRNATVSKINETMQALGDDADAAYGIEGVNLLQTIIQLKTDLDAARGNARDMEKMLRDIEDDYDATVSNFRSNEKKLIDDKNAFQTLARKREAEYKQIEEFMEKSTDDQIGIIEGKLKNAEQRFRQKNLDLLGLQTKLTETENALRTARDKLESIKPQPNVEVFAYRADAKIVDVDLESKVVFLDIGSDDHVYPGLTFGIFDDGAPIPEDGKGKGEIEVYDVRNHVSMAKIVIYSKRNPIVPDDVAINLVWDSKTNNKFVVAGGFDFDRNGSVDRDGNEKVKQLIEEWNGRVADEVTIETDVIVLGTEPRIPAKPSAEQIEFDPMVEQRYNEAREKLRQYNSIIEKAQVFSIPIFNQKQFMYLIGHEYLDLKSRPL